ncbi:alpha,alpha-trehalose-phosphate synthase (UDP-forming) [Ramlibacter algicola]|uniref:Trehalose-6-phosphate synthase n=1 Tax=Ramlibacter algicola TaxID=2795217 RepID=A0A934US86_9BURK|nr:trehalose-6-phosphate synthase [Ramlibacter algicola]MBK0393488.1 trehalose-6-phosphate synthase [Ramlibacter algicola]
MKNLQLQLRFLVPLILVLAITAWLSLPVVDRLTLRWFARDLDLRGELVANTLSESVADALREPNGRKLRALFGRAVQDERLVAIGWCSPMGEMLVRTPSFPPDVTCAQAVRLNGEADPALRLDGGPVHLSLHEVRAESGPVGQLVLLHDLSFIERRSQDTRRYLVLLITGLGVLIALVTMAVAQLSWRGWIKGTRALLRGEGLLRPLDGGGELAPLAAEVRTRLRDLEDEYRRAATHETGWDAARLQSLLRTQLRGDEILVVSNREPYIHEQDPAGSIVVRRPASGLVTAVEPVMRACSGTWIAHGSGSADRDVVDRHDRVSLPPGQDDYRLRRVWLTEEQEQGYYYGFANEGLWPLCHVAHVRPVFRESDWRHYREVNQRFADAVVAEARSDDPVVLVQDYHFALLPAMVRSRLPRATILTFWHIPWPNPESFGICPWRDELLEGMLGSTIMGFHTPTHGKNFLESVDRYLEARIEHEHSTVSFRGEQTFVAAYPISIEWPTASTLASWATPEACRAQVRATLGIPEDHRIAVGVDRFDYTKGILERLHAVERLLEKYPQWRDTFTFVQVAAPTRASLEEYQAFQQRIHALAERINRRFSAGGRGVVRLLAQHHEPEAVTRLYRAADACLVTSLHDGMNLVCKEFVAARDDEQGVLVLSRFAGAARDLPEALVVNPYHVEEVADALHRALTMPPAEQRERMASLRSTVREFNVYRWAGHMLADAARWRLRERVSRRVLRHGSAENDDPLARRA